MTTPRISEIPEVSASRQGRRRLPHHVIDVAAIVVLTALGLLGFHASFGGWWFLASGIAGCLLGAALAWLAWRTAQPGLTLAAASLVTVVVLGGFLALRSTALAGLFPTLDTVRGLAQGFTRGWVDLATTPPPAGDVGNLLAIPYLCGFLSGLIGVGVALRDRRPLLAVVAPLVVLAASIFTGVEAPVSLVLQGAAFGLVTVAWWSWRTSRRRSLVSSAAGRSRTLGALALLAMAVVVAPVLGPHLPGSDANGRVLLRTYVEPQLDVSRYPSPLAGVRKYLRTAEQRKRVLFTVTGAPTGTAVRLAVMDAWDGTAAGVAGSAESASSGEFRRVGSTVPTGQTGMRSRVQIEVRDYNDYWVPTVGGTATVQVDGPRSADVRRTFYYNAATDAAISTSGLTSGDRLVFDSIIAAPVNDPERVPGATVNQPSLARLPDDVAAAAGDLGAGGPAYAQAAAVARKLHEDGFYTPHGQSFERPPGHGAARLAMLMGADQWVGDEEQYGAAALLMARQLQVPARLVLGFRDRTPDSAAAEAQSWDVRGEDLDVWLEVALQDVGWVPVDGLTPPRERLPAPNEEPKPKPRPEVQVPPKPDTDTALDSANQELAADRDQDDQGDSLHLPGWVRAVALGVGVPLLLIAAYAGIIVGAKRRRRGRRRANPDPGAAVAGGWQEVLDVAFDNGVPRPPRASTRREASRHLAGVTAVAPPELFESMARRADGAVFGPVPPTRDQVEAYWRDVQTADRSWAVSHGRWGRLRARLSPKSLLTVRPPRLGLPGPVARGWRPGPRMTPPWKRRGVRK